MAAARARAGNASTECVCCGRRVYRMHGLVILLRYGDTGVALRLRCVGYCAEHRGDAIDAAVESLSGRGRVVGVSAPELVRPSRQGPWRRATTARLTAAGQDLLGSVELVGEPLPYPTEPVPSADAASMVVPRVVNDAGAAADAAAAD